MVRRRTAALVLVLVLGLAGCTPAGGETRDPVPPPAMVSPMPSVSPTPSQQELTKQVQAAYQIAFDEFERLSREGGADQPSAKMVEVEDPGYLKQDLALLRNQKEQGYRAEGRISSTRSRPVVGAAKSGSDERLTLQVCEDRRGQFAVLRDGRRIPSRLSQGFVYAKLVDGRVRLVDIDIAEVSQCAW